MASPNPPVNPYQPNRPMADPAHFYGQEAAFAFIRQQAFAERRPRAPILIGRSGIGKTSILWQVPQRLDARTIAVYVDLALIDLSNPANLWIALINLSRAGLEAAGVSTYRLPELPSDLPAESLLGWFVDSYLSVALAALRQARRLLFLFDNTGVLLNAVERTFPVSTTPTLFDQIGDLLLHDERLKCLFALDLADAERAERHPLLSDPLLVYRVPYLADSESEALIREPVVFAYGLHSEAARAIRTLCGGFPYALHAVNQAIFDRSAARNHDSPITLDDVIAILPQAITAMNPVFDPEWQASSPQEKRVLASLSTLIEASAGRPIPREVLITRLTQEIAADSTAVPDETSLIVSLRRLEYQDVIRIYPDHGYAFAVGLHQQWLLLYGQLPPPPPAPPIMPLPPTTQSLSASPPSRSAIVPLIGVGGLIGLIAVLIFASRSSSGTAPGVGGLTPTSGVPTVTLDVNLDATRRALYLAETSIAQTQTAQAALIGTGAMQTMLAQTPSATNTASITPTASPTITTSATTSLTSTATPSITFTTTPTASSAITGTRTATPIMTASAILTNTASPTLTRTLTRTFTPTLTPSWTVTLTPTLTLTVTPSVTDTPTPSPTDTPSMTDTATITLTPSPLPNVTIQSFPTHLLPTSSH